MYRLQPVFHRCALGGKGVRRARFPPDVAAVSGDMASDRAPPLRWKESVHARVEP